MLALPSACAHSIHELYIGSQDPGVKNSDGQWITVKTSDFVIAWFTFNTDYIEKAHKELESKCAGRLAQITTEHLTSFYFLSYDQTIVLKGLCLA